MAKRKKSRSPLRRIALHPLYVFGVLLVLALVTYSVSLSSADDVTITAVVAPTTSNQNSSLHISNNCLTSSLRDPAIAYAVVASANDCGLFNKAVQWIRDHIWVVGPATAVGGLMTASFWLGEKEALWHLTRVIRYVRHI